MADIITQYLTAGDISGFIIAIFTTEIGLAFWGLLLLGVFAPIDRRLGLGPAVLVLVLIWNDIQQTIPAPALNIGIIIMCLVLGVLLAVMFIGRRSPYA